MRKLSLVVACLAATSLTGCWLQPGFGPARQNSTSTESAITPSTVGNVVPMWSAPQVAGHAGQPLVTTKAVYTAEVVGAGGGAPDMVVTANDRATGAQLWRRDLAASTLSNFERLLSVAGDKVLVLRAPDSGGLQFEELDGATGATLRTQALPPPIDPDSVLVDGDFVAYRSYDLDSPHAVTLVVRQLSDFSVVWSDQVSPSGLTLGPMVASGGVVYTLFGNPDDPNRGVAGFNVGGCGAPTCNPVSLVGIPPPSPATPNVAYDILSAGDDGVIFIRRNSNIDGTVHGDLELVGGSNPPTFTGFAHLDGMATVPGAIYVVAGFGNATGPSALLALNGRAAAQWRADVITFQGEPIVAGGLVYAAGTDGLIRIYDAAGCGAGTCTALKVLDPGGGTIQGMSDSLGWIYVNVGGDNPRVVAFALPT